MFAAISRMHARSSSPPVIGTCATRRGRRIVEAALLAASFFVSGCAATHSVDSPLTTAPATEPLPVHVGIRYSPALGSYTLAKKAGADDLVGPASIAAFDVAFGGLFREHTRLTGSDVAGEGRSSVDTIEIRPGYGACSGSSCSVQYFLDLHSRTGELIATWEVNGHGIRAEWAVRDAVAGFVIKFVEWSGSQSHDAGSEELAVRPWLAGLGIDHSGDTPVSAKAGVAKPGLVEVQAGTGMILLGISPEKDPLAKCVQDAVVRAGNAPPLVAGKAWRDALFPWFEPGRAPRLPEDMARIFAMPAARERASALGARYLLWINGQTQEDVDWHGPLVPGLAGVGWWDKRSWARAEVWDLASLTSLGFPAAEVSRPAIVLQWTFLVLPLVPPTETSSCDQLAQKILALRAAKTPRPELPAP